MKRIVLAAALVASAFGITPVQASPTMFMGSYAQNFNLALTNSATAMPTGFRSMSLSGDKNTYTAAAPFTASAIASGTATSSQTLTVWNFGSAAATAAGLINVGSVGNLNDRALGSDPTGISGMVIELSMTNATGGNLPGVTFSYDCKCLANGSGNSTEASELPGYSFFYSLTGSTSAADWTRVDGLCLGNYTQGTTLSSGNVTVIFPNALTNNGVMYFRWADDNNVAGSPDQMLAIDNINITAYTAPVVSITSPANNAVFASGSSIPITASAVESYGTITNVAFYSGSTLLGNATSAPYSFTWPSAPDGNYALTAVASDSAGNSATSSVVNIIVGTPNVPPTVSLTSPANNAAFNAPASISLSATAADADGTVTNVAFYQGTTLLANVSTAPFNFTWPSVSGASYTLTAVATDNSGASTTSSVVNVTVRSVPTVFSGSYTQDFNSLGLTGTTLPVGFRTLSLAGDKNAYTNGWPISTAGIAAATASGTNSLLVWNFGSAVTDSATLINVGSMGDLNDRALGSDPTSIAARAIELSMTNATGGNLLGVTFSYDCKCLTNGSGNSTEASELPGYSFFYSLTGSTSAADWTRVDALCLGNCTEGTTMSSGTVTITFPTPLANNGIMYFRWADDNAVVGSPDQMLAIDNIGINACANYVPNAPVVVSPAPNATGVTNHAMMNVVVSDPDNNNLTVTFYGRVAGTGDFTAIGTVAGVPSGNNAFVTWFGLAANTSNEWYATASDGQLAATNSVSQFTTASSFPAIPPTVTLTSPANNSSFLASGAIVLTAAAADADGMVTNVAFYQGTTKLADVATSPFSYNWSGVAAGNYAITAIATDDDGLTATSSIASVSVTNSIAVQIVQQIKTIFVIPLENHDWQQACPTCSPQQILGNPAAPYVNSLITPGNPNAAQVSYATKYYMVARGCHPSEPNYIWSEAGTEFGVHTDNDPSTSSGNLYSTPNHLCRQLTDAGIPWKDYQEDVEYCSAANVSASGTRPSGTNIYNGSSLYNRAVKHDPMQFFTDTQNRNVYTLARFWTDVTNNAVGRYNWITPDQYNEMHSSLPSYTYQGTTYSGDQAAIAEGDNFLSIAIPKIMASAAYQDHGVIIIWTDETESTDDTTTTLPFIIISPLAKGNAYASSVVLSHSSTLKTMDEIFGLSLQTNAIVSASIDAQGSGYNYVDGRSAIVNDLSDMFLAPPGAPPVIVSHPACLTNCAGTCASFHVTATGSGQLSYQWYFGANLLACETNSTLGIPLVGPANVGSYYVVVTSGGVSVNSDLALLTVVYQAPTVVGGQMMLGAGGGFQLTFSGPSGQTYQVLASDVLTVPVSAWPVVGSGTFGGANVIFADPSATNHIGRFYIIKSP